jgi:hypothetical protein
MNITDIVPPALIEFAKGQKEEKVIWKKLTVSQLS